VALGVADGAHGPVLGGGVAEGCGVAFEVVGWGCVAAYGVSESYE